MKKFSLIDISLAVLLIYFFSIVSASGDDTCAFMVTADDVPPNIVILLDNGAAMEEIVWYSSYDNNMDYTPVVTDQYDVVQKGVLIGNGFFNENGYGIIRRDIDNNGIEKYYLVNIPDNLNISNYSFKLQADGDGLSPTWTINSRTVTLPAHPENHEVDGVIDNATNFRYSKNYLNWIFFGDYSGNGNDLPSITRFYQAKKALMTVGKLISNQAKIGIFNFTANSAGASNVQPLNMVVTEPLASQPADNTLDPNYINNINNMGTVTFSPLAEGLARVGGYYGSASTHIVGYYCQKNFVIVISPGKSSEDLTAASQSSPSSLSDYDDDNRSDGIGEGFVKADENVYTIPVGPNGSTYLDDVAYYLYNNDIVDYEDGFQNVRTYTIGFMGDSVSNLFLKNASNNGNGNTNLYDTSQEEYGKYHYETQDPNDLAEKLLSAVKDIISQTSAFTAPVVPVTRTTSGNKVYMAFFKPTEGNFWEGNVTKFGLSQDNLIVDKNGDPATWPNGAIRDEAKPFWQTKDWGDSSAANYIHNSSRNIYTYLGTEQDLTHPSNAFSSANLQLSQLILGKPVDGIANLINYVRGADVFDEDQDGNLYENRMVITGDVLHSEPAVFQYQYPDGSSKTMVFFGSNDGMLHVVLDEENEISSGQEAWSFVPPEQLPRLRLMIESSDHQYYVDSSPKIYFKDVNGNGLIETNIDVDADGDVDVDDQDQVILICGEKKGASSYFALDITDPMTPKYLWRIARSNCESGILQVTDVFSNASGVFQNGDLNRIWDGAGGWGPAIASQGDGAFDGTYLRIDKGTAQFNINNYIGNLTTEIYQDYIDGGTKTPFMWSRIVSIKTIAPNIIIPELGQSWSEPQFGIVKTSDSDTTGTPVFFIGGGYSPDNSYGKAIIVADIFTGTPLRIFKNNATVSGMDFSIVSAVSLIDADSNGFIDKAYVGDLGGQIWRLGKFVDDSGVAYNFPDCDENIMNWNVQRLFESDPAYSRKIHYPPAVTLEDGYDLIFFGTGDREEACSTSSADRFYCFKDSHGLTTIYETDLVDVTDPSAAKPDLDNSTADVDLDGDTDLGWFIQLPAGEKVLAEPTVFYKNSYFTTFAPNADPCVPGGFGKFYALGYKTSGYVFDFDTDGAKDPNIQIGGGIPSKVVPVITDSGTKFLVSVGSTNPDLNSGSLAAGVVTMNPVLPKINFFYLWWKELSKY